jgi:hypothetical protein
MPQCPVAFLAASLQSPECRECHSCLHSYPDRILLIVLKMGPRIRFGSLCPSHSNPDAALKMSWPSPCVCRTRTATGLPQDFLRGGTDHECPVSGLTQSCSDPEHFTSGLQQDLGRTQSGGTQSCKCPQDHVHTVRLPLGGTVRPLQGGHWQFLGVGFLNVYSIACEPATKSPGHVHIDADNAMGAGQAPGVDEHR